MSSVQIKEFQEILKQFLENGRIEDAILCFKDYLKKEKLLDSAISNSLIIISSGYRKSFTDFSKKLIDYDTYSIQINNVTNSLLQTIDELPKAKELERKKKLTLSTQNKTITAVGVFQEDNIINLRQELLSTDEIIIKLLKKIDEKEREVMLQKFSYKMEALNDEIDKLRTAIKREEEKYKKLKHKYDKIQKEKEKIEELVEKVIELKKKLIIKTEKIAELQQNREVNQELLIQKELELIELKQKAIEVSETSIIINKTVIEKLLITIGVTLILISVGLFL